MRGAERLRFYAQLAVSDHKALSASLAEAEPSSQRGEKEVKEDVEKVARVEVERDAACQEALMACMDAAAMGNSRTQVESKLARVQNALTLFEEARRKAEDEANHLVAKRGSLILELGTFKDEVDAI